MTANDKLAEECERLRDDPVALDERGTYKPGHAVWCGQVRALLPRLVAALRSTPPTPKVEAQPCKRCGGKRWYEHYDPEVNGIMRSKCLDCAPQPEGERETARIETAGDHLQSILRASDNIYRLRFIEARDAAIRAQAAAEATQAKAELAGLRLELSESVPVHHWQNVLRSRNKYRDALKQLALMARTSGGVAGRDDALCKACDEAEELLAASAVPGDGKGEG